MNGDVNGSMDEPMDINLSTPDTSKLTPASYNNLKDCEDIIKEDSCNTLVRESVNGSAEDGIFERSANENSSNCNLIDKQLDDNTDNLSNPEKLAQELITKFVTESPRENGHKSDPELSKSSHSDFKVTDSNPTNNKVNELQDNVSFKENEENGCVKVIDQDVINEDGTGDDFMADDGSAISGEPTAEDTVSIDSNSDCNDKDAEETSQESQTKKSICDIMVKDSENRPSSNNSEVQEIGINNENDDCIIAGEEKIDYNEQEKKGPLRRSSRAIKRKRYTDEAEKDDESYREEVEPIDPFKRKIKPIVINDAKALIAMAARQMKANQGSVKKKDPTLVIIDSNLSSNKTNTPQIKKSSAIHNAMNAQNSASTHSLYQSIIARGTSVTPVSIKSNNIAATTTTTQNSQSAILPSLTDDMFVVEAPSFIVPYVYEKPSLTPFREFVDKLGKQLEEERLKEKEKRDNEKQEKRERGEVVSDDPETVANLDDSYEDQENKRKKSKKGNKKRNMEDDASWDGESSTESLESGLDSDDEVLSDHNDKIVVKEKIEPIEQMKVMADLTVDKICSNKSIGKSSMDCSLGKFFINIGLNLVQEYVQSDLLKQQNRKLNKEKKSGQCTKATESSISQLVKNLEFSKENNAPYNFVQKKCELCSFKTDSKLVMAEHLDTPHMKNNMYKCNFCTYEIRNPHEILYHMESVHNVRGKLERAPCAYQCANCPYEDNGKGKLARHLIACAKKFKPDYNLAPPVEWEPPAKIPKIARSRNSTMSPYQTAFQRSTMGLPIRGPVNVGPVVSGNPGYRPRGKSPMGIPQRPPVFGVPIMRPPNVRQNNHTTLNLQNSYTISNNNKPKSTNQLSISITPLPRQQAPNSVATPTNVANNKNSFVICEICDGYIKDLEQLRNHMQWIHKVKIHPKMIYNRPPLNCQKCQFRFFTDQGFERHLLGSHGLVTSSMQEAANKGKDAGRCPVCGRVYQWKLLNHVARDHNITLKPGHLSYKCTVCTATFGMYKQFESHVYSAHSVVAKRVMDKNKTATQPTKVNNDNLLKPLKINEEITVTQSVKSTASKTSKDK